MDQEFDSTKVLDVLDRKQILTKSKADKLVVLVGPSQSGKSTAINAFRGCHYRYDSKSREYVMQEEIADPAQTGKAGGSCTIIPELYQQDNLYFFDLMGYGDTHKSGNIDGIELNNSELQVVSSLITELLIKEAKELTILVLVSHLQFRGGITSLVALGDMISRYFDVNDKSIPLFILFNRFSTDDPELSYEFSSQRFSRDPANLLELVKEQIKADADEIYKHKDENINMDYYSLLYENIQQGHFSYIELQNQQVIDHNLWEIGTFPTISPEKIKFETSSDKREKFNKFCTLKLQESLRQTLIENFQIVFSEQFFKDAFDLINNSKNALNTKLNSYASSKSTTIDKLLQTLNNEISSLSSANSTKQGLIDELKRKPKDSYEIHELETQVQNITNELNRKRTNRKEVKDKLDNLKHQLTSLQSDRAAKIKELDIYEEEDPTPIIKEEDVNNWGSSHYGSVEYKGEWLRYNWKCGKETKLIYKKTEPSYLYFRFQAEAHFFTTWNPRLDYTVTIFIKKKDSDQFREKYNTLKSDIESLGRKIGGIEFTIRTEESNLRFFNERIDELSRDLDEANHNLGKAKNSQKEDPKINSLMQEINDNNEKIKKDKEMIDETEKINQYLKHFEDIEKILQEKHELMKKLPVLKDEEKEHFTKCVNACTSIAEKLKIENNLQIIENCQKEIKRAKTMEKYECSVESDSNYPSKLIIKTSKTANVDIQAFQSHFSDEMKKIDEVNEKIRSIQL